MNKEEALKIILKCSKIYRSNLENKNIMFISQSKNGDLDYIETIFLSTNFLHLTGINIVNKNIKSSRDFYNLCIKNQISISDFEFNSNGTTFMKLQILPHIVQIQKISKMIGNYNNIKMYLSTKKVVGNVNVCIGFIKKGNYYIPNTALKEDIRNITDEQSKIIAVLVKNVKTKKYNSLTYINKNTNMDKLLKNEAISKKIDKITCKME